MSIYNDHKIQWQQQQDVMFQLSEISYNGLYWPLFKVIKLVKLRAVKYYFIIYKQVFLGLDLPHL